MCHAGTSGPGTNTFYRGETDLLVLVIDAATARPEIRRDPVPGFDTPLPHICGPLNPDAVVDAVPLQVDADGRFRFDGNLRSIAH